MTDLQTGQPGARIPVLVADASPIFAMGLEAVFERAQQFQVVGRADSAERAYALYQSNHPRLVICGMDLSGLRGLEICRRLTDGPLPARVILTAEYDWDVYLVAVWKAGAAAFVPRNMHPIDLLHVACEGMKRRVFTQRQLDRVALWEQCVEGALSSLNQRERETLVERNSGATNQQIAQRLSLSIHSIEKHVSALHRKFGVGSRSELDALMRHWHLAMGHCARYVEADEWWWVPRPGEDVHYRATQRQAMPAHTGTGTVAQLGEPPTCVRT